MEPWFGKMRFCGAFTIPDATGKSTNKMQFVESTIKVTDLASILEQCCAVLCWQRSSQVDKLPHLREFIGLEVFGFRK